ncbi:MAG: hypothetical protein C0469_10095 [Cyanobacteria bacterium DS2.3.42]|nr:hypothetical protein [Cyanobacteria bacterium DS2.3.42]
MLLRLILLVTAGVLLIGGAFLWINHINDETRMAEALNSVLPPKRIAKSPQAPSGSNTTKTVTATTTTTNSFKESVTGIANSAKTAIDPSAIGTNIAKLKDTIKNIPNQFMPAGTDTKKIDSLEQSSSKLALNSQSPSAFPAITREQASPLARVSAGKPDPLSPISGFKQFPAFLGTAIGITSEEKASKEKPLMIPPPPPGSIPPPPPPILTGREGDTLPLDELPVPPEKPSIAKYLKLVGILGDRAFMSVTDPAVRRANRLPKTLAVSAGDRVEYLNVVAVSASSVTLEENGQTHVKHLTLLR